MMFDAVVQSNSFKRILADHPRGANDYSGTRALFKRVIWCLQDALENTEARIDWDNNEVEAGRRPAQLVIYSIEDDETTLVPLKLSKCLIRLGEKIVFVSHARGAVLLLRAIWDEIEKTQLPAPKT